MKRYLFIITILMSLLALAIAQETSTEASTETQTSEAAEVNNPSTWPDPFEMKFDTLSPASISPSRHELSNGMIVYLLENHELPLVDGVAYIKAPSVYDPDDKVGLADLTASMLREGGAAGRSVDDIDEKLEFLAASVESSANPSFAQVSFSALSENVTEVMETFADVILQPDFDAERLEVSRGRVLESIRRQNDNPVQVAVREFFSLVVDHHPSGRYSTVESVNAISRDDLISFHERYFAPNASYLAISGDFDSESMLENLEGLFADWQAKEIDYPELPELNMQPGPKIYFAAKDVAQSTIIVGHPSVLAYSPEYNALVVANGILGGEGFSSRIMTEVRTKRGLAYTAGSALNQGFDYPGVFYAFSISRGDTTAEVLATLLSEIKRFQDEGVTEDELSLQKDTILNRAVFRFTSASAVAERTARAELLGLAANYYDTHLEDIQAIDARAVQSIAQQELHPDEMIIMVVGNPAIFDRPLSDFGEVIEINLE
ncbi:MAG: pitrilysin family protein [Deinococcales bacterium]